MEVRNLKYNQDNSIDCEVNHHVLGWIPFTARESDSVEFGLNIYKEAIAGTYGEITPYTGLSGEEILKQWRKTTSVTKYQFSVAMQLTSYLGDLNNFLNVSGNEATKLAWENASVFSRDSYFIENLVSGLAISDIQMDDIFKYAVTVEL